MYSLREVLLFKVGPLIPDRLFIQLKYFTWFRKFPNLKHPRTYNEKLNWLKLYDRRQEYVTMVDKFEAKKYISDRIGEDYVIPVVAGPWESIEEIDFAQLPEKFVLKTTHDCGGVVVCKNKSCFDIAEAKAFLHKHLTTNYFYTCREWPYRCVKPRIFAEAYMQDEHEDEASKEQLTDYKFFCFDGHVKALFIATDRADESTETKFDFFDSNFQHLDLIQGHPNAKKTPAKPRSFEKMKELAEKLSRGFPQLRVDFYEVGEQVYVGELTLFHFSGTVPFKPEKWDYIFGEWITLPIRK